MLNHVNKVKVWLLLTLLSLTLSCDGGYYDFSGPQNDSPKGRATAYIYPSKSTRPELEFSYFDIYDREPVHKGSPLAPQEVFSQSTATQVWVELEVKNLLYRAHNQTYELTFKYFQQNGRLLDAYTTTWTVKKSWEHAWYYDRWGWDSPGHWPLGTHRVEAWINGTKFATKNFSVVKDSPHHTPKTPCQSSWWRTTH